ncbi:hypothetical protein [Synechocystis sp. PCC 7509]|uniref:hypothetical protein n=1 Tax=Synechocystis sp. PCC 7509 TaxID=927677 RepID=UPI0002ACC588|nr:hypothetical protein [Synechocystis sp. PCC 7509]
MPDFGWSQYPIISPNDTLDPSIIVPQGIWKVVISEDTQADSNSPPFAKFGVYVGNSNRKEVKWDDNAFVSSIETLERYLNSTHQNSDSSSPKYNFFNNLPTQKANELKSDWIIRYKDGSAKTPYNALLLAEESKLSTENISFYTSPVEVNFSQSSIIEAGTSQVAVFKGGLQQVGFLPISIAKVAASENATTYIIDPSKVGIAKVSVFPLPKMPNSVSQISFPHNTTTEVNIETRPFQINTTEINTSGQFFMQVINSNITKISLSSSISPQQFLNGNFSKFPFTVIHSLMPNLDNIYSTATSQWYKFLDLTTPFDVNFQVVDLRAGQLERSPNHQL